MEFRRRERQGRGPHDGPDRHGERGTIRHHLRRRSGQETAPAHPASLPERRGRTGALCDPGEGRRGGEGRQDGDAPGLALADSSPIVPVSADQLDYARTLLDRLPDVRADLDDSGDTLSKKIRTAEKEWVPYIAVIGKQEIDSGTLNVRVRETKEQTEMSVDVLRKRILAETKGLPFRPLAEPALLSARPVFRG